VILRESVIFGSTIEFEVEIKQKSGSTFYHSLCLGQLIDRYKLKIVLGCGKREFPDKIWLGLVCWSYPRTEVLIISMWKTGYLHRWQTGASNIEEEEAKPNYPCNKNPHSKDICHWSTWKVNINVSFVMIIMLGCAHPIYARQGDKIFDYSKKPFCQKPRKMWPTYVSRQGSLN